MGNSAQTDSDVLVQAHKLTKKFRVKGGTLRRPLYLTAVSEASFTVRKNETVGLVGESGCGKSTTGRLLLDLIKPTSGEVVFEGKELSKLGAAQLREARRRMQFVFQDPYASLDPRHRILSAVGEPLAIYGCVKNKREKAEAVAKLLQMVGMDPDAMYKYPHEFSGGQRQRICIARALALRPSFVVADEPVSALDVSIQSQVINLLMELKRSCGLSYLFISHDLGVVKYLCDRVAVMYLGRIVELSEKLPLFEQPLHPYTRALLRSVPQIGQTKPYRSLNGEVPSPMSPPSGCVFHPRCECAKKICREKAPPLRTMPDGRQVACWLYSEQETEK